MNRQQLPELLGDLEDLKNRARDAGTPGDVLAHLTQAEVALRLHIMRHPERDSVPPLVEQNAPARTAAGQAFRNASKLMKGLLK